ncbi:MAG: hypothetical protein OdinLCB4_006830 [Candidatus Odinarchaeum yellowstonii]|uniref:Uncharacterized protein n=1 Tax=Odinarchaeota yellowstonii (strain LCB_4) TaxID=1841599 RepID=A0AAF0IAQ9_ODILC|nr:MAG: hypothetical protein OdinLCB4_006830 [Candidatus Odinarchaeum yellowstonii]
MGLGKAVLYSLITFVSAISLIVANMLAGMLGVDIGSFQFYSVIILVIAVLMAVCSFIENYYVETKTVVSGVFGLIKHLSYIFWVFYAFQAFTQLTIPASLLQTLIPGFSSPVVLTLAYDFILTLIMVSLGVKLVAYLWQIAFYRDIQKRKGSEFKEIRGKL